MKIEESADGTIKVIELDPTKWYWFIVEDRDVAAALLRTKRQDGMIIVKRPDQKLEIIENADRIRE